MATRYSYDDIARDFSLWGEYADPHGIMSEEDFDSMTVEEKIELLQKLFGNEEVEEEDF